MIAGPVPIASVLAAAKPAFGGDTEAASLLEAVDQRLRYGAVRWLDVGSGDGRNLALMLDRLRPGRQIEAIAVEPAAQALRRDNDGTPNVRWVRSTIESFDTRDRFELINVRQSAYYFADPPRQLTLLSDYLAPKGLLVLTHWSADCVLYGLHRTICESSGCQCSDTIEELCAGLTASDRFDVSLLGLFESAFDQSRLQDDLVASAIYDLSRRLCPDQLTSIQDRATFVRAFLTRLSRIPARSNGIVLVQHKSL